MTDATAERWILSGYFTVGEIKKAQVTSSGLNTTKHTYLSLAAFIATGVNMAAVC